MRLLVHMLLHRKNTASMYMYVQDNLHDLCGKPLLLLGQGLGVIVLQRLYSVDWY